MKSILILSSIVILLALSLSAPGETVFKTHTIEAWSPGVGTVYSTVVDPGVLSKPEAQDPFGNWGGEVEGFRLSLRFDKATFKAGEAITATLLLRNVSDQKLTLPYESTAIENFDFVIATSSNTFAPLTQRGAQFRGPNRIGRPSGDADYLPEHQRKFTVRLDEFFDLSKEGEYIVFVKRMVPKLDGSGRAEIRSSNAIIHVGDNGNFATPQPSSSDADASAISTSTPAGQPTKSNAAVNRTTNHGTGDVRNAQNAQHPAIVRGVDAPKQPVLKSDDLNDKKGIFQERDWYFGGVLLVLVAIILGVLLRARSRQKHA